MSFFNRGQYLLLSGLIGVTACAMGEGTDESYQARRAAFQTTLLDRRNSSPLVADTLPDLRLVLGEDLPGKLEPVTYPGPESELKAWLYTPSEATRSPAPALLFLHAGWRLIPSQQPELMPFIDAGYVIMWPTHRGEHGNPGSQEMFLGEVEDAAAAARWLAAHPAADPDRVYALGWSGGGGIATLLSLWEDVPLRHTATSGGLFGTEWLRRWARTPRSDGSAGVPFDTTRVEEFEIRVLPGNFHWMKRPHYAYIETQSERWIGSIAAANEANMKGDTLIQVIMVPGDHFSAFPEVVRRYMALIEEDSRR